MITALPGLVFQGVPCFEDHLKRELGVWKESWGPLYYTEPDVPRDHIFWYQNCWLDPFRLDFDSISEAAASLRALQRNWAPTLFTHHRRGALIGEKLPPLPLKPKPFPYTMPSQPMGSWTLLDAHTLIASARCTSPFPGGVAAFIEDTEGPPSRAYRKLWEALTLWGKWPGPGERCLDAGASPGGWTWALSQLGAAITAVDRAPLEPRIQALPGVRFIKHDAFTLKPEDLGPVDWLFCDVVCYPRRLYGWIEQWLQSGLCRNYVCTIKMQGAGDDVEEGFAVSRRLADIPGSRVVHLYHNKHELTWMYGG